MGSEYTYLDEIEQFIQDENLIVTYKWLSRTLEVHVNKAKQMLHHYLTRHRNTKKDDPITATYFISGTQSINSEKVTKYCVTSEDKLDNVKSSFDNICSLHIYSVQKSIIKDENILYIADYDKQKENILNSNRYSSIRHIIPNKSSIQRIQKDEPHVTPHQPSAKPFVQKSEDKTQPKGNIKKTNNAKPGIASMFAKQADQKSKPDKLKVDVMEVKKIPVDVPNSPDIFDSPAPAKSNVGKPNKSSIKAKRSINKRSKKKQSDDSDDEVRKTCKKRRRILEASSSSSESEEETEKVENEPAGLDFEDADDKKENIENQPTEKIENVGKVKITQSTKNKKRKFVHKTYVDDEGFMVTKKEWVTESESDPEESATNEQPKLEIKTITEKNEEKIATKKTNGKKIVVNKAKQSNLMNFFKKKDS